MSFLVKMRQAVSFCSLFFFLCVCQTLSSTKREIYPVAVALTVRVRPMRRQAGATCRVTACIECKPHLSTIGMNKKLENKKLCLLLRGFFHIKQRESVCENYEAHSRGIIFQMCYFFNFHRFFITLQKCCCND